MKYVSVSTETVHIIIKYRTYFHINCKLLAIFECFIITLQFYWNSTHQAIGSKSPYSKLLSLKFEHGWCRLTYSLCKELCYTHQLTTQYTLVVCWHLTYKSKLLTASSNIALITYTFLFSVGLLSVLHGH